MLFLLIVLILFLPLDAEAVFEKDTGLMDADISFLALNPFNDGIIYAAAQDTLYRKESPHSWRIIYRVKEGNINFVYPDPAEYGLIFIAADTGLLLSRDEERFAYVFRDRNQDVKCFCVRRIGSRIYLGTSKGLYQADMGVYDFKKVQVLPSDLEVYWIDYAKPSLYLATNMGVYQSQDFKHFNRTFVSSRDENIASVAGEDNTDSEEHKNVPTVIKVDIKDKRTVYLGTNSGLFVSSNGGMSFVKTYLQGLPVAKINFILQSMPELIYIATDKGLFKAYPQRRVAMNVYEGLPTREINCIGMDKKGKIYLATSQGVFIEGEDSRELMERQYQLLCKDEPGFREVQEQALAYNEVSPEKIRAWRRSLRYRALMPQFKLGYDKTIQSGGTGSHFGDFEVGPSDWSMDFTWDLDNLIWNTYEDDVDTRARLNTQLRIDILNEVNRLYFERLRVKEELLNKTPKNSREYIKQMMYLKELTAALDAYTGGYYSKRLEEIKSNRANKK